MGREEVLPGYHSWEEILPDPPDKTGIIGTRSVGSGRIGQDFLTFWPGCQKSRSPKAGNEPLLTNFVIAGEGPTYTRLFSALLPAPGRTMPMGRDYVER